MTEKVKVLAATLDGMSLILKPTLKRERMNSHKLFFNLHVHSLTYVWPIHTHMHIHTDTHMCTHAHADTLTCTHTCT